MTPDAYYWIAMAYASISGLSGFSLVAKAYNAYKLNQSLKYSHEPKIRPKPMDYVLHGLHIPPYLLAAYWYYDAYLESSQHDFT